MKFAIVSLGCKVNRVESDDATHAFLRAGWQISPSAQADVILVNTCAVTGEAEKKTRKAIRHVLRENTHAPVLVTGCASALNPQDFSEMNARIRIVSKANLLSVVSECINEYESTSHEIRPHVAEPFERNCSAQHIAERSCKKSTEEHPKTYCASQPKSSPFRTRVGVKIQDGCNNACTYCIVHVARGRATSRPAETVVNECVSLARSGVREIVLTGIDLGSYCDTDGNCVGAPEKDANQKRGINLDELLQRLLSETANIHAAGQYPCRFRLSSIEPHTLSLSLAYTIAQANGRICRHLHIPLQSGSSRVLHMMARPYSAKEYYEKVERLYALMPQLSISTDIICGFPGEQDTDFEQTLTLAQACRFSKIHVFPFSPRKGTPAAQYPNQISTHVRTERAKRLRELGAALRADALTARSGTRELALVESDTRATTESYFAVPAPEGALTGQLVEVCL